MAILILRTSIVVGGSPEAGATLVWAAPTQNADNSSLTDLAGYNIYRAAGDVVFGSTSLYRDDIGPGTLTWTDPSPLAGTSSYYVTAYDSNGDEGAPTAQYLRSN